MSRVDSAIYVGLCSLYLVESSLCEFYYRPRGDAPPLFAPLLLARISHQLCFIIAPLHTVEASMQSSACSSPAALHHTPAVKQANDLLWQHNPPGGGVLVRNVLDAVEDPDWFMKDTAKLLPASFLHATLRPSNAVFDITGPHVGIGILVGKHLNLNQQRHNRRHTQAETVNVSVCYPGDAGTIRRTTNVPNQTGSVSVLCTEHGKGCRVDLATECV